MNEDFKVLLNAVIEAKTVQERLNAMNNLKINISKANLTEQAINEIRTRLSQSNITLDLNIGRTNDLQNQVVQSATKAGKEAGKVLSDNVNKAFNIDDVIDKEVNKLMSQWGASGKAAFSEIRAELVKYRNELINSKSLTGEVVDELELFANAPQGIRNVGDALLKHSSSVKSLKQGYKEAYQALYDYINAQNKSGNKIFLNKDIVKEFGDDFSRMRNQLGAAFSSKTGIPFDTWIEELNKQLGNVIDLSKGYEFAFKDLVEKMNLFKTGTKTGDKINTSNMFDMSQLKHLESEINTSISNIDNAEKKAITTSNQTTTTIVENEKKKQESYRQTSKIQSSLLSKNAQTSSNLTFENDINAAKKAEETFKNLLISENNAIVSIRDSIDKNVNLKSFIVDIKHANGEVESLTYSLKEVADGIQKFVFNGATTGDLGIEKKLQSQNKIVTDYEIKLQKLQTVYSNLNLDTSSFEKVLLEYKNGTKTLDELRIAYANLENTAKNATENLKSQKSSFDPIQQALNNMRDFPSMLKSLETGMDSLKDKSSLANVSVKDLSATYDKLMAEMLSTGGKIPITDEWIQGYKSLMSVIASLTTQVETLKKAESSLSSSTTSKVDKIRLSIGNNGQSTKDIEVLRNNFEKLGLSAAEVNSKMASVTSEMSTMKSVMNSGDRSAIISQFDKLTTSIKQTKNAYATLRSENSKYASQAERMKLAYDMEAWLQKNDKATKTSKNEIQGYITVLKDMNQQVTKAEKANFANQLKRVENQMRGIHKLGLNVVSSFRQGLSTFTSWLSVSTAVMTLTTQIRRMPTMVKELNDAVVDLTMATNASKSEIDSYINSYKELASTLGATVTDVTKSATEWLKQGKSIAETEKLVTNSMVLSKIGALSATDATKYLTSAMKGYKISVEDSLNVVDKLSAVDLMSATSVGGLAEGMSQVAASAELAGVSMDKLLGYLAVIGETTQDGMSSVGTALNSVFSRMGNIKLSRLKDFETGEDLSNVETVLRGQGIVLRDSANSFRNFGDVLDETSNKWESFSDVGKRAIASAFAGVHHANDFIILMENYGTSLKYTEASLNSSGEAMKKYEGYQEGVTARIERTKNAFITLSDTLLGSELLKSIADFGTKTLETLNSITDSLGSLGTLVVGGGLFAGIKNVGKMYKRTYS